MPKNEKNKKSTTKSSAKKVVAKKVQPKKDEKKKEIVKKVEVNEVVDKKKGTCDCKCSKLLHNTPFVIALGVIVVLLAVVIFLACYKRVPKTSKGKEVIATMKGKTITADDLYEELKSENGTSALVSLIDDYIADKEVKFSSADKEYLEGIVSDFIEMAESSSVDLSVVLQYYGFPAFTTEKEFSEYLSKLYKKDLAVIKFIGDSAKEEDLKKYYSDNYSEKITARHILIEVNEDTDDAAAKKAAEKLIKELKKTDSKKLAEKFEKLAIDNSDDTGTYANGGLIENFGKNDVVEAFWNAALELKDGEYTKEPIRTTYGYHIILKVSSSAADKYEDVIDNVKNEYAQSLLKADNTLYDAKWEELRKQYKLSIKDDVIKKDYEKIINQNTKTEE